MKPGYVLHYELHDAKDKDQVWRESVLSCWNSHLEHIRSATNKHCFKRRLKTYYFNFHFIMP